MGERINRNTVSCEEDAALVRAFQAAEETAFDKLVLKHKGRVFNLCYRILGDYEEADDCAQEAFVKVYRSLNRFRFKSAFSTWLYRIAVNTCKNRFRSAEYRNSRKAVRLDGAVNPGRDTAPVEIADTSLSPAVEVERKEMGVLIRQAIDSLPEEQKMVVVLRDVEGMTYEEIAGITGYNPGTVKSKLARGRRKLREKLSGMRESQRAVV